jgi:hypothetical protein
MPRLSPAFSNLQNKDIIQITILVCRKIALDEKYISRARTIQVLGKTAQQELFSERQSTGLES